MLIFFPTEMIFLFLGDLSQTEVCSGPVPVSSLLALSFLFPLVIMSFTAISFVVLSIGLLSPYFLCLILVYLPNRKKWIAIVDLERPNEPTARRKLLRETKWETTTLRWSPHRSDSDLLLATVGNDSVL